MPFICTKPLYRYEKYDPNADRCHIYRRQYPGGNWIECDKLIVANSRLSINASCKCCLFDLNMRETFWGARSVCAKFNSFVYSFKSKGYKKILENYAKYLSLNQANRTNDTDFWTSCRLENDEIKCDSNVRTRQDEWRSSSAISSSHGSGLYLSYILHKKEKFRLNYLNMSLLMDFGHNQSAGNSRINS